MKAVPVALFLGAISLLAGCRHVARVHAVLPPSAKSDQTLAEAKYVSSVIQVLPAYIKDEQNARFEQAEIAQVEEDLNDIETNNDANFHQQVRKLSEDVGQLEAKDKYLEANRIGD